ncbi:MAG: M4 family metallopeptidase, partial [Chloroflexaceae bacterium]
MKRRILIERRQVRLGLLILVYGLTILPLVWSPTPQALRFSDTRLTPAPIPLPGAPTPQQAFAALQARTTAPLEASFDPLTGVARFVQPARADDRLPYVPTAAEAGKPEAIARGFLDQNRALFGLRSAAEELRLLRYEPDAQRGFTHLRFDQLYQGLPVFGRQLVVHLDPDQRIVAVNGQFHPQITITPDPAVTPDAALAAALLDLRGKQLDADELARIAITPVPARTRLVIYVDERGGAALAWQLTILTTTPLGQWTYFVNARRPLVIHAFDSIMHTRRRRTFTAQNTTRVPGRLIIDEGERSRDPVAQAAHDGAGAVYDYFFASFQRNSIDGRGMPLVSTVNFGSDPQDAENAAWIGEYNQIIYGDGGRIFKPLPFGLDVIGHEFTHGITQYTADLIYEGQSGALNESYSDVFAVMIDRDDWLIGEDVIKSPPYPRPYLRSMQDPNAEGAYDPRNPLEGIGQPATMAEYANLPNTRQADNGGVHINSGIPNHAHYLLAQAIGREKTEQIAYRALTQYLTPSANFVDAAKASARAAADLYGQGAEVEAVRQAFARVGITDQATPGGPVISDTPGVPSGGPAPERPAPALPAGCSDIVIAGGFEQREAWIEVARGDAPIIDTQLPRSGRYSAWLGGQDQETLQYLYQDVRVPANATRVELRYARLIHEETTGLFGAFAPDARFSALFATLQGDPLQVVEEISSRGGDDTWRERSFDVSRLAGRSVRLVFASENPRGNVSSMFVDDVALIACTTGEGPAAPPTSNAELVYIQGQITDASTRRGIEGVQFLVMRPGITASRAAADDTLSPDEVLTFGVTDRQGVYRTQQAVPRGQTYSVIVFGSGYRPIIADQEVSIPANATNPYRVDAELRRGRCSIE